VPRWQVSELLLFDIKSGTVGAAQPSIPIAGDVVDQVWTCIDLPVGAKEILHCGGSQHLRDEQIVVCKTEALNESAFDVGHTLFPTSGASISTASIGVRNLSTSRPDSLPQG
jgi:hypothetical protein